MSCKLIVLPKASADVLFCFILANISFSLLLPLAVWSRNATDSVWKARHRCSHCLPNSAAGWAPFCILDTFGPFCVWRTQTKRIVSGSDWFLFGDFCKNNVCDNERRRMERQKDAKLIYKWATWADTKARNNKQQRMAWEKRRNDEWISMRIIIYSLNCRLLETRKSSIGATRASRKFNRWHMINRAGRTIGRW